MVIFGKRTDDVFILFTAIPIEFVEQRQGQIILKTLHHHLELEVCCMLLLYFNKRRCTINHLVSQAKRGPMRNSFLNL